MDILTITKEGEVPGDGYYILLHYEKEYLDDIAMSLATQIAQDPDYTAALDRAMKQLAARLQNDL